MNKRTIKIEKIININEYSNTFNNEIKKIQEIPKMPKCEFIHIGATSREGLYGETILDILVVVENLHEITIFDEKRLNGIKGIIKYARLTDYFTMSYDVILYIVQRGTDIHQDFLRFKEVFNNKNLIEEYNKFKSENCESSYKEYSLNKIEFINKMIKRIEKDV